MVKESVTIKTGSPGTDLFSKGIVIPLKMKGFPESESTENTVCVCLYACI